MEFEESSKSKRLIYENSVRDHVNKLLKNLSLEAVSLDISPGTSPGDNYLGLIAKVNVKAKDHEGNLKNFHWIVKSASTNEIFRFITFIRSHYQREINMYENVFPAFENFQKEIGIVDIFKPYPKFYYSCLDNLKEAIILENMTERNYQIHNRHITLDFDHILLLIRSYAKFHAMSFALKDQKPEVFCKLKKQTQNHLVAQWDESFVRPYVNNVIRDYQNSLDPATDKVLIDKLEEFENSSIAKISEELLDDNYGAFTHGDCWTNNMLFFYGNPENPRNPTDVCFVDFQLSVITSPIIDVIYTLFANTDGELRKKHFVYFLKEYYTTLSDSIRKFGSCPETLYPIEIYQKHLKEKMFCGLIIASAAVKLAVTDKDEVPDVHSAKSSDDFTKTFRYIPKRLDEYKKRFRDLFIDFVNNRNVILN